MVQARFELFDHTADMGVRVWAASMKDLVPPAVAGFYSTVGELVAAGDPTAWSLHRELPEPAPELLLRDFLTELLVLLEREHLILTRIDAVEFTPKKLGVEGGVATIDAERSVMYREVKAVTYHELYIRPVPDGFEAAFIVDI